MITDGSMVSPSPLALVFDRLRAMNPSWDVALGEQEGPLWIRGTDLAAPDRGKLRDLLDRIGAHLETSNRKVIAAGQIFSSWGAPMTQILGAACRTTAEGAVRVAMAFFDDPRPEFAMRPRFYTVTSGGESRAYHRRASCCLYYKLPEGALCASCPLLPFEESVRRGQAPALEAG